MLCLRSTPLPQKDSEWRPTFFWASPLEPDRPPDSAQTNAVNASRESPANYDKMRQRSFISARMGPSGTATMAVSCPPRVDPCSEGFLPPAVLRRDDFTRPVPAKACMPAGSISPVTWQPFRLPRASRLARQERRRAVFREGHYQRGNGAWRDGATVVAPQYE
jgi:hypothetical protein